MKFLQFNVFALLFFIIAHSPSSGQKKDKREGAYSAYLYSAEGSKKFVIDSLTSVYEDSLIKIDWLYSYSQMGFDLENKAQRTIRIIWDDAAFISIDNESSKVFHKGIKYTDRENSQPPTSVYKNTSLSDLISPTSHTRFVTGQYGGWTSSPLIPVTQSAWANKIEYVKGLIGRTMRVVLPIKSDEGIIEYTFYFRTTFMSKDKRRSGSDSEGYPN